LTAEAPGRAPLFADVVVVGAGLAGLQCARLVAEAGLAVILLDRKEDVGDRVHTTGIFVRKSLEDFTLPPSCLGPPVRRVVLYSPARRALRLSSRHEEFRVGRMGALYGELLDRGVAAGVRFLSGARYRGSRRTGERLRVEVERDGRSERLETRFLVGADGANSQVARDLGLDSNTEWLVGWESVHHRVPLAGAPALHCFLDPRVAPGYLAWVVQDGEETHVGVGGYPDRFHPQTALREFTASLEGLFALDEGRLVEHRGGRIPVNGVLPRIGSEVGLLVGDAAGAVSPLTAGGFDACLRLSRQAAAVIVQHLQAGDPDVVATYSGARLRARFWSRRWMRALLAGVRSRAAMELVCLVLRCPPFRNLAWQVFFRRRSFPDAA
jgi:flavin-dependent dehydrogenase